MTPDDTDPQLLEATSAVVSVAQRLQVAAHHDGIDQVLSLSHQLASAVALVTLRMGQLYGAELAEAQYENRWTLPNQPTTRKDHP